MRFNWVSDMRETHDFIDSKFVDRNPREAFLGLGSQERKTFSDWRQAV
jgi:hypothetical protein